MVQLNLLFNYIMILKYSRPTPLVKCQKSRKGFILWVVNIKKKNCLNLGFLGATSGNWSENNYFSFSIPL